MRPRRPLRTKTSSFGKPSATTSAVVEHVDLSSYLSYALLILYVLASVSSTKDEMLLIPSRGIQLPLVSVTVPVVGFYLLSPLIVLIGHLVTLRRIPMTFPKLLNTEPHARHEQLNVSTDYLMVICLLFAGPVTLLLITCRFAAYQSPVVFLIQAAALVYACYATLVRFHEVLPEKVRTAQTPVKWACYLAGTVVGSWLLLCADVILIPAQYSATVWLKTHTALLDNEDEGTIAWIPHIHIDRADRLWSGVATTDADLAEHSGKVDAKELFMTRGVALDLRSRNLRFLDISQQVIPRVWAHDADLSGANLSFTRLYGSVFVGTKLNGASFDLAALDGSTFMHTTISNTTFRHARLKGSYWDNVVVNDSDFLQADLSLASLYGVKFNRVVMAGTDLTATSLFETEAADLAIGYVEPYKILTAVESDELMKETSPVLEVAPEAALAEIAKQICRPNIDSGWTYAWSNFLQIKSMVGASEPGVMSALQGLFKLERCKDLPDRGFE